MPRLAPVLVLVSSLAIVACERPFVPLDPPTIEIVSPNLAEVQTADQLPIVLRVSAVLGVADVTIDGENVSALPGDDLYGDTLAVAPGLNSYVVEARGEDGNDVRDTLRVLRLSLQTAVAPGADLPVATALHAAAGLADGSVILAGGVTAGGAVTDAAYRLREQAPFTFGLTAAGTLSTPRAGHSAHALPDGRVLILGGSSRAEPATEADFVAGAEVFDPVTGVSNALPSRGDPVRRSGHVAFLLRSAGRTYFYVVGGRGPLGEGAGTPSSVVIAELRGPPGSDTLVTLTPPGGAGILEPVTAPAGLLLDGAPGGPAALVAGLYAPDELAVSTRLRFLPGTSIYPFQVLEERLEGPEEPRDDGALAPLDQPATLAFLLGGRTSAAGASARISVYSAQARRWFSVPLQRSGLRVSRFGHTATLLPSGRIALVGGFTQPGAPTASAEILFTD